MSTCARCGESIREGYKFCNACGARVGDESGMVESIDEVVAYSKLGGLEGRCVRVMTGQAMGRFLSIYPECSFGRREGSFCLPSDATLSPMHAMVRFVENSFILYDLDSLNGIFIRIRDRTILRDHDVLRAGNHYFLYEHVDHKVFREDTGTEFYSTPSRGERFRLVEIIERGIRGRANTAPDGTMVVGRREGSFVFLEDDSMNGRHFSIRWTQRGGVLVDHHSVNGTFVQMHEPRVLESGDQFFVGATLFSVI